jgi:phosphoribosylamine--glycine ligase
LIVGSGGREHALAWKIHQSPRLELLLAAPGSSAIAEVAECFHTLKATDIDGLVALATRREIDLVVVGPEDPLAAGIADRLREAGVAVFGPSAAAAQLESSKAFSKAFMERHAIPTASWASFEELEAAVAHVRELGGRCVVKADGLAAGKGVAMCENVEQAEAALVETMTDRRFGEAGARVVIEEWIDGEEASYYVLCDGERILPLIAAQDHKRALDGDRGENTGGMGAYSPAAVFTEAVEKQVLERVVHPVIRGMAAEGNPYVGVLFVGLMIDAAGDARVIEFNVRFGDPETQVLMMRLEDDLLPLLDAAARGLLPGAGDTPEVHWGEAATCVALASGGYPRSYETGKAISGLEEAATDASVIVFHAGTRRAGKHGFETAGGRVLGVTARGDDVADSRTRAYAAVAKIRFEGMQYRRDIGARALDR